MLIDETNWKQELSMRKAMRIYTGHVVIKQRGLYGTGTALEEQKRQEYIAKLEERIRTLDKAIETIENVFVHKRCYI